MKMENWKENAFTKKARVPTPVIIPTERFRPKAKWTMIRK